MQMPRALERPNLSLGPLIGIAGLALASLGLGFVLARLAVPFGQASPLVLLGLVVLPLTALAIIIDPRIGVAAVFLTFPMGSVAIPTGFASLEIVNVAVVGVALLVALRRLGSGVAPLPWHPALWWALALIVWTIVALPSALDQELAVKEIVPLVAGVAFACVVVSACKDMDDVRKVIGAFVGIAVVIAAGAFAGGGQFEASFGGARVAGRAANSFDHSNQLGCLSALAALSAIGLVMGARTRRGRILAAASLPVLIGGQLLSLSRGAWIGTVVAVAFLVITIPRARRALIAASIPLLLAAILVGAFNAQNPQVQVIGERFSSITVLSPYDDRSEIWQEAAREIVADPLTGHGPGSFPVASARAASEASTVFAYHAHNILLTWAAENGLPAALLMVAFGIALAGTVRRTNRRFLSRRLTPEQAVVGGVAAALVALVVQGVIDYTLRNSVIFFALWALIGVLLAADRVAEEQAVP